MIGAPGVGKTMLASRLPGILPPLSTQEALEIACVSSVRGITNIANNFYKRPFRKPHHTISNVALVGGGSNPKPGEISLAHNGVLFLDELPEFERRTLEVLREPLEAGSITISRAGSCAEFPANFQLISAMNPCPCGYRGSKKTACHCSNAQIARYMGKLSGPLLDRIDMHIELQELSKTDMFNHDRSKIESTTTVATRIEKAYKIQLQRQNCSNNLLTGKLIEKYCVLDVPAKQLLQNAMEKLSLSARAYHKIIKVARSIADLANTELILASHIAEAIGFRKLTNYR